MTAKSRRRQAKSGRNPEIACATGGLVQNAPQCQPNLNLIRHLSKEYKMKSTFLSRPMAWLLMLMPAAAFATATPYPPYPGAVPSVAYKVSVDGKPVFVHSFLTFDQFNWMDYASFSMTGKVHVELTCMVSDRKSKACSARLGSFRPKKAWHASRNWPHGWISGTLPQQGSMVEGLEECFSINRSRSSPAHPASLLGDNQHHRKPTRRSANPDPSCHSLAKRQHGNALDGLGFPPHREAIQQDHGPSRSVGLGSHPQSCAACFQEGRCVVTLT